jgi:hypothetical protein
MKSQARSLQPWWKGGESSCTILLLVSILHPIITTFFYMPISLIEMVQKNWSPLNAPEIVVQIEVAA